jgi:hypothetical protein
LGLDQFSFLSEAFVSGKSKMDREEKLKAAKEKVFFNIHHYFENLINPSLAFYSRLGTFEPALM